MLLRFNGNPSEYKEIFDSNLAILSSIDENSDFHKFIKYISDFTEINYEIVSLSLKRYLMISQEYYPENITKYNSKFIKINILVFLAGMVKRNLYSDRKSSATDYGKFQIFIDNWAPTVVEGFYGKDLIGSLKKEYSVLTEDFSMTGKVRVKHFFRYYKNLSKCFKMASVIEKKYKIKLMKYICNVFFSFISGMDLKERGFRGIVISGNDNGFNTIKAKASLCNIMLIQNGGRGYLSDSTFGYADCYLAMDSEQENVHRIKTGNLFKSTYNLGSLRLFNYLQSKEKAEFNFTYDILWISSWPVSGISKIYDSYYDVASEKNAIRLINELSNKGKYSIAYQCSYKGETEDLKIMNLYSENIKYFMRNKPIVYENIFLSNVILSTGSTVNIEALASKIKCGFVNMSDNELINYPFALGNLEYSKKTDISFEEFIEYIKDKEFAFDKYITQEANYAKKFLEITREYVK